MISVLPVKQAGEEVRRLLACAPGTVLEARERGALLGAVAVVEEPAALRVTAFALTEQGQAEGQASMWQITELMLRAAASYAANRLLPVLIFKGAFPKSMAERFGFVQTAEEWRLGVPGFLGGCKNCEKT